MLDNQEGCYALSTRCVATTLEPEKYEFIVVGLPLLTNSTGKFMHGGVCEFGFDLHDMMYIAGTRFFFFLPNS